MSSMKYRNLYIWNNSCSLSVETYKYFVNHKNFDINNQIRKSSLFIVQVLLKYFRK